MKLPNLAVTVIDGKYQGVSHDYSPSAWIHHEGHGPDLSQTEHCAPDFNLRTVAVAGIASVHYGERAESEKRQAEQIANVNEIVKRSNTYPKLVEMLKAAAPFVDYVANNGNLNAHGLHVEMLALLREIGEAA